MGLGFTCLETIIIFAILLVVFQTLSSIKERYNYLNTTKCGKDRTLPEHLSLRPLENDRC